MLCASGRGHDKRRRRPGNIVRLSCKAHAPLTEFLPAMRVRLEIVSDNRQVKRPHSVVPSTAFLGCGNWDSLDAGNGNSLRDRPNQLGSSLSMSTLHHVEVPGYPARIPLFACRHRQRLRVRVWPDTVRPARPYRVVGETMQNRRVRPCATSNHPQSCRQFARSRGQGDVLLARPDLYREMNEHMRVFPARNPRGHGQVRC